MQIEENFRDGKSLPFGMGAEIGRSRSAPRLQALLLIATLAAFVRWHRGQLAEAEGLHRRYKVTTRACASCRSSCWPCCCAPSASSISRCRPSDHSTGGWESGHEKPRKRQGKGVFAERTKWENLTSLRAQRALDRFHRSHHHTDDRRQLSNRKRCASEFKGHRGLSRAIAVRIQAVDVYAAQL